VFAGVLTLFLTPVLYDLMARFTRPRGYIEKKLAEELAPREKAAAAIAEPVPAVAGGAAAPAVRRSKAVKRDDDGGEAQPVAAE
jgi:hypothetical protein